MHKYMSWITYRITALCDRSCGGRDVCTNSDQIVCTYCFRKNRNWGLRERPFL